MLRFLKIIISFLSCLINDGNMAWNGLRVIHYQTAMKLERT